MEQRPVPPKATWPERLRRLAPLELVRHKRSHISGQPRRRPQVQDLAQATYPTPTTGLPAHCHAPLSLDATQPDKEVQQ